MVARMEQIDVLVVDDEQFIRQTLAQMLKLLQVKRVREAVNGRHAMAELMGARATGLPNLILCDVEMDLMGGVDFVSQMRRYEDRAIAEIPVIMVTAHSDVETVKAVAAQKVGGFLVKPVTGGQLKNRIEKIMALIPAR